MHYDIMVKNFREAAEVFWSLTDNKEFHNSVFDVASVIHNVMRRNGKVFIFGNGGSFADSVHFAAELVVKFKNRRRPLPAIALGTDPAVVTAIGNDYNFDCVFERQLQALMTSDDAAFGITTSGNSRNVNLALNYARSIGAATMVLTGSRGLCTEVDYAIRVPAVETARIQEVHGLVIHVICDIVENSSCLVNPEFRRRSIRHVRSRQTS